MNTLTVPYNETTNVEYKGGNVGTLALVAQENEFSDDHGWATFKQWIDAGRSVKKGEHGTRLTKWMKIEATATKAERLAPRTFVVFHFDQTQEIVTKEKK